MEPIDKQLEDWIHGVPQPTPMLMKIEGSVARTESQ
jgi:hypothetical protein